MKFDHPSNLLNDQGASRLDKSRFTMSNKIIFNYMMTSLVKVNHVAGLTILSLAIALSGCSSMGQSQLSVKNESKVKPTISQSRTYTQPTSAEAKKLTSLSNSAYSSNIANSAQQSDEVCNENCEDIDAVPQPDQDIQSYEDIDSQPAYIDNEDDDNEVDDVEDERLGVEHVPLNAISPQTLQAFVEVVDIIRHDYVRPVNDEILFQQAISGMLERLDKHAEYLTPEDYDNLRSFTDGEIDQVGLLVKYNPFLRVWEVTSVLNQSSAKQQGIMVGDRLISVKNVALTGDMTEQDVQQMLSGIAGSKIEVTITNSQGGDRRNISLQRNLVADNNLTVSVKDSIAIIRLPVFQNGSKDKLIEALKQTGVAITGVVIDVRNNPGGVLSSAIDIASLFIKNKDLIQVRNRTNNGQIIKSNGTPYLADLPVVILQNRYSASASEVLASSFKSNNRATIMGEQSFGKGTVQEVIPLDSGGGIKLTVAEYRSAKGEHIDGIGVKPDITLYHDGSDWQQLAVNLLLSKDRPLGIKFDTKFGNDRILNDY
ncbi:S41 family peptidase [Psychrobacter sp.]|uniref:S41 family peptidase n=1 Tax=Psychrobacter sp. TaxID=56811 RepID=UPI0025E1AD86|nr:S41 family peptidase [Psychrobacter sp.]